MAKIIPALLTERVLNPKFDPEGPDKNKWLEKPTGRSNSFYCVLCRLTKGGYAVDIHNQKVCSDCVKEIGEAVGEEENRLSLVPKQPTSSVHDAGVAGHYPAQVVGAHDAGAAGSAGRPLPPGVVLRDHVEV